MDRDAGWSDRARPPWSFAQPAAGLVDEAILEVVDAFGAQFAFPKIPDFVPVRRTFAGDHVHLIVAVEMDFVAAVTDLLTLSQLFTDVRVSGGGNQRGEPVQS